MAVRDFSYDHPVYLTPGVWSGSVLAGAAALSQRFVAHANMTLQSVEYTTAVIGTGAATDAKTLFILQRGTATTTTALFTTTAAIYATSRIVTNSMAKGDVAYIQKGTDATEVGAFAIQYQITPGAPITY